LNFTQINLQMSKKKNKFIYFLDNLVQVRTSYEKPCIKSRTIKQYLSLNYK